MIYLILTHTTTTQKHEITQNITIVFREAPVSTHTKKENVYVGYSNTHF